MKAYWWNDVPNFGDAIGPILLDKLCGIRARWAPIDQASLVVTGSVIHHIPNAWSGAILGAGLLRNDLPVHVQGATVLAVRGPLTADAVKRSKGKLHTGFHMGDPGLLADTLVGVKTKRWDIGILPHWSDNGLATNPTFQDMPGVTTKLINPRDNPVTVVRQIGQCRKLVTSSLHGVIVADSFGLPRRIEHTNLFDLDTWFKFEDYHQSIRHELAIGKTTKAPRGHVEDRRNDIYDAFRRLA